MTALAAERFIKRIVGDHALREKLYATEGGYSARMAYIRSQGFVFNYPEYEDAISHLKSECPTEEQDILLGELLLWWQIMNDDYVPDPAEISDCPTTGCKSCHGCG